mmetsp:Transcript_6374/g.9897  ORF Transcript_6374/g.9897 Transcript_6374/m.9897 type:complete len:353 (-) Transcript_6374:782-1840(-)|eukprot:CAMPEP_0184646146 /NCGR_PEP_ID=MMETSP0308-20130426/2777_1 /TAXON_ID=38269 /ORGANISM="Gloeochaete witrockiana, Strain SAG 46.84" /LENGTH=352 /DNA_ID=CAMNT_0027075855 /DNA_START=99 /DNA_END=1157 /DNA_ORIENTATION=+
MAGILFPLIDAHTYRAYTIALDRPDVLETWIVVFERQIPSMAERAAETEGGTADARMRAEKWAADQRDMFKSFRTHPNSYGCEPNILLFCDLREKALRKFGFPDPYREIKARENELAVSLLPEVLQELDTVQSADERLRMAMDGVFAGNIFDLGAVATIQMYRDGEMNFRTTRTNLRRPYLIDHVARFIARLREQPPYHKVMIFVDNAGSDVVLGIIPFARELLRRGVAVVLAANSAPSVNDITHAELVPLLNKIGEKVPELRSYLEQRTLTSVASGNTLPAIDLSKVSEECAKAASDVDLVVLEGMGRALESNFDAKFKCDSLKMAMVKHKEVATYLNGQLLDVVCKFEQV